MPTSGRPAPSRDRPGPEGAPLDSERATPPDAPIEPPQYFDPGEPWDAQSAEALTQLYESGEGYLHRRPEDARVRRLPPLESPAGEPEGRDQAWLDSRLAQMAERLHGSLAEINPDKAVAHLNRRLDAIEERFNEALSQVVQRSDLDGLKLIEAHVMELAAHVEQTRGRLDRIDAIDEQMQGLARLIEQGDHQRLDALERLLHDYVAEWRKGDERTASALRSLEDVVSRVGESIDAMEAQKPAQDLSLGLLDSAGLGGSAIETDPLSHVYADAARVLEPTTHRSLLDAADYAPRAESAAELQPARSPEISSHTVGADEPTPAEAPLPPPSLRALAMRANQRQAQLLRENSDAAAEQAEPKPLPKAAPEAAPPAARRTRSGLLFAGGLTLFAAIGYLLVDVLMTMPAAPRPPAGTEQSARPPEPKAAAMQPDATPQVARIEAIGNAMAAAFRPREGVERPRVESTASIQQDTPATPDETTSAAVMALPMTIGPASLRQAAMRGEPVAQVEVASRFAAGQGVGRDLQQAFYWYGRAAAQGQAVAQFRFAALYEGGLGTARDVERARVWYTRAAAQGNVKAMHNLAVLSVSGGRADYAAAAGWFAKAADFGLADSQVNLAILYQSGRGVPKDLKMAYKWLALARRGGDEEVAARLAQVRARLSTAELEATDAAIADWRARTPDPSANATTASASLDLTQ